MHNRAFVFRLRGGALLCLAMAVVMLAYLPGLRGPTLLDDVPNIGPIVDWAQGTSELNPLMAERKSGPLGRPVSLLSFMGNALTTGGAIWSMKLTNVVLHLLTGLALFGLLRNLLPRDSRLVGHAGTIALAVSVLWLVLPQHVVSVLYTVQRMTVLASLFSVLGLWSYAVARDRMRRSSWAAAPHLLMMVVFAALAVLSKESALVFPLLLLIVEWTFFSPPPDRRRPPLATAVAVVCGVLPVAAAVCWLALNPDYVLRGYDNRDFDVAERVYSQFRILWEYAYSTFLPLDHTANLYNDDYTISRGLFDPPLTAVAALGWLAVALALWHLRRYKVIVGGILFFLAGHALESTIFPLEIYFVHRNYLPSMGLILALIVALYLIGRRVRGRIPGINRWSVFLVAAVSASFAISTASRAHLWGSMDRLMDHAEISNPGSLRLRTDRLRVALESNNFVAAQREIEAAYRVAPQSEKRTVRIWSLFSHCHLGVRLPDDALALVAAEPAGRITNYANLAMLQLRASVLAGQCPELAKMELARIIAAWADQSPQSPRHRNMWEARGVAATMYAEAGSLDNAGELARRAFVDSGYHFDLGVFAYMLAVSAGSEAEAAQLLEQLHKAADPGKPEQVDMLQQLQSMQ